MVWPIHVPSSPAPAGTTADAKPLDKVLNRVARGTIHSVSDATGETRDDLLAALAAAGEPAPSVASPVWAYHSETDTIQRHRGAGWETVATMGAWATYSPTPSSASGALTAATASGRWTRSGRLMQLDVAIVITNAGTASGSLSVPLPVPAEGQSYGIGRETQSTGVALTALAVGSALQILRYDNASMIGSGRTARVTVTYEAAS